MRLKSYACDPVHTRGRLHAEPVLQHALTQVTSTQTAPMQSTLQQRSAAELQSSPELRSAYQRDRDRIVHSSAFRRLVYKTQVFLNHEGDLFRTRMTHSLEVAQLGRSIARALQLDEDLVEAIALAHDLGHTPFGHAGQDALNDCMQDHLDALGGFEHNLQSLRVVDTLEERYPQYNGLNLTFETREGILKHCSAANARRIEADEPHGVAYRFIHGTQPSLEAQLANIADQIAYNAHDIDDGVRSGLITMEQLVEVPLFAGFHDQVMQDYPHLQGRRVLFETIRRMLSAQVHDVISATRQAITQSAVHSVTDVRAAKPLVQFSPAMQLESQAVKRWLFHNLYRHPQVSITTDEAKATVRALFGIYLQHPAHMPAAYAQLANTPRAVADYIAGMTDRFAIKEHDRLR
jgi:dGTPase